MTTLIEPPSAQFATECRIVFRQPMNRHGFVDAGWWPRSNDLAGELPALLDVFWTAGREMTRITYNLDAWPGVPPIPRTMFIAGHRVHIGGYHLQNRLLLTVADASNTDSADLLIVAPDTDPATAERLMALASAPNDTDTPEHMMELTRP